jgi:predicted transcriptional regulator
MSERRRRDAQQIKYEVLMAALPGCRKTHIMYEAGLNLKQLNLYLAELTSNGALIFEQPEKKFVTTEKGKAFIKAYDHYRETINLLTKQEAALAQFFPNAVKRPMVAGQVSSR